MPSGRQARRAYFEPSAHEHFRHGTPENYEGKVSVGDGPSLQRPGHAPDPRVRAALTALEQGRERTRPPADADGDGLISEAEFLATPAPGFDRADRNADGVLSAEELAAIQDRPARRLRQTP